MVYCFKFACRDKKAVKIPLASEKTDAVGKSELFIELFKVRMKTVWVRFSNNEHDFIIRNVDFINCWQSEHFLIAPSCFRFKYIVEPFFQLLNRLLTNIALGCGIKTGNKVLDVFNKKLSIACSMQIPGSGDKSAYDIVFDFCTISMRGAEIGEFLR